MVVCLYNTPGLTGGCGPVEACTTQLSFMTSASSHATLGIKFLVETTFAKAKVFF
jgi:hypothetical protein